MAKSKWNYNGDLNLEHGGYFWREDGADDYVLVVRVQPCSDAGGPDNLYDIEQGSLYMPNDDEKRRRALSVCGWEKEETPTRDMLVDAFIAYGGIDRDCMNGETIVRIGPEQKDCSRNGWNPAPDVILRSNASLKKYVEDNFLN